MEEDQDSDYGGLSPGLSLDEEDRRYNGFVDHSLHGSGDGDEILSPFHSSDERRKNERTDYSARSDYSDEGHWVERVRSSPKRRKIPEVDRISDLPDSVIHRILSFLQAEDAIKTGVLSKRWMYLWTFAPKLTFRQDPDVFPLGRFLRFVDETLFFYASNKMEKFELDFDCIVDETTTNRVDPLIQKWLRFVARRLVEELSLKFCGSLYPYPIPQFVFNSSSLTKLSTTRCYYAPKGQVCWTSLRVLTIERTELSNEVLQNILAGSPMLEYLEVRKCWSITRVDGSSSSRLEKLVLKEMQNYEDREHNDVIEILCPNLKSVEISGCWLRKICRLLNVSSLIDVCLTFELGVHKFDYIEMLKELLEKIKHVKKITISTWCVQVLSLLEFRGLPSPLSGSSCECLTLNTELNKWYPFGLAHLLHCFPTLQKLVIDMAIIPEDEESPDEVFPENYLEKVKTVKRTFSCLLEHLKTIEIKILGFRPYEDATDELGFVSFLLGNARVLKETVIKLIPSGCTVLKFDLG